MATAPYGSWRSPITAHAIAAGQVSLGQVEVGSGAVYWTELRPAESGRVAIVERSTDGLVGEVAEGFNARTRVHEYGGGSYLVHGRTVVFSEFADQRLYRADPGRPPVPITPDPGEPAALRYADGRVTPSGDWLICVRERHDGTDVHNELVAISLRDQDRIEVVASGHDFYGTPRISPDGTRLAWITWDHPRMPWDGTELWVAELTADAVLRDERRIAGSTDESVIQPQWSPDGVLHYLSDRTGFWNLYLEGEALAPMSAECGGPMWVFGQSSYALLADGRVVMAYGSPGDERLGVLDAGSSEPRPLEVAYTSFSSVRTDGEAVFCIAADAAQPPSVVRIDPGDARVEVLRRSRDDLPDPRYVSSPEPVAFPTTGGRTAHALYYPPRNPDFEAPAGERPPLVVFSHGGPTGATSSTLNLTIQYFTSRGIAVVDVNYGGSTGYGREYRDRLKGSWGIVDIDDCCNAAQYLAGRGQADERRLAIRGGSAGGYTTLGALVFRDVFAAGASYYGVGDLASLAEHTHKFESRYLDGLVGPYPEAADVYRERSPIHHVGSLSCPVIFFQGLEDRIVPPQQAQDMVGALASKGLPYAYLEFEGEQHGFRRSETIVRTLEAELYFYSRVFGFDLAEPVPPVDIENL